MLWGGTQDALVWTRRLGTGEAAPTTALAWGSNLARSLLEADEAPQQSMLMPAARGYHPPIVMYIMVGGKVKYTLISIH